MTRKMLISILVLITLLTGCATPTTEPTPPPQVETEAPQPIVTEAPTEEPAATEAPVVEEEITLRFILPEGGGRPEGYTKVLEAYKKLKPNVTITLETIPFKDYNGQLPVMWASSDPADIALVDSCDVKYYAHSGALAVLDNVFTEEDKADIVPSLLEEASLDGVIYGAPFVISTQGVFYNTEMFEDAGITVPQSVEESWTWDEYVEKVKAVVANEKSKGNDVWGLVFITNPPNIDIWSHLVVRSFGEKDSPTFKAISDDGTQVSGYLDTPEAMEAYKFWQDLYVTWKLAPQSTVPDAFGNKQAATMISFAAWGGVLKGKFPDLKWGVAPLPYARTRIAHLGEFVPVASANGKNVEAAKEFLKFLASSEGILAYNEATTMIPVRKSLIPQIAVFNEMPLKLFADQMVAYGVPRPMSVGHPIYNSIFGQMMVDIAQGADINVVVPNAVSEIDSQLAQYK
ncbi:MAG: ABC transporter substrate-binding protein [Chloroflexota bacterium]